MHATYTAGGNTADIAYCRLRVAMGSSTSCSSNKLTLVGGAPMKSSAGGSVQEVVHQLSQEHSDAVVFHPSIYPSNKAKAELTADSLGVQERLEVENKRLVAETASLQEKLRIQEIQRESDKKDFESKQQQQRVIARNTRLEKHMAELQAAERVKRFHTTVQGLEGLRQAFALDQNVAFTRVQLPDPQRIRCTLLEELREGKTVSSVQLYKFRRSESQPRWGERVGEVEYKWEPCRVISIQGFEYYPYQLLGDGSGVTFIGMANHRVNEYHDTRLPAALYAPIESSGAFQKRKDEWQRMHDQVMIAHTHCKAELLSLTNESEDAAKADADAAAAAVADAVVADEASSSVVDLSTVKGLDDAKQSTHVPSRPRQEETTLARIGALHLEEQKLLRECQVQFVPHIGNPVKVEARLTLPFGLHEWGPEHRYLLCRKESPISTCTSSSKPHFVLTSHLTVADTLLEITPIS